MHIHIFNIRKDIYLASRTLLHQHAASVHVVATIVVLELELLAIFESAEHLPETLHR